MQVTPAARERPGVWRTPIVEVPAWAMIRAPWVAAAKTIMHEVGAGPTTISCAPLIHAQSMTAIGNDMPGAGARFTMHGGATMATPWGEGLPYKAAYPGELPKRSKSRPMGAGTGSATSRRDMGLSVGAVGRSRLTDWSTNCWLVRSQKGCNWITSVTTPTRHAQAGPSVFIGDACDRITLRL